MITITNVQPVPVPDDELSLYVLRINDKSVQMFGHKRKDGLAECLRAAANALDEIERIRKGRP